MEKSIFCGDLYIKCAPTRVFELVFDEENSCDDEKNIEEDDFDMEAIMQSLYELTENIDEIIEEHHPTTIESQDYSGNIGFYRFSIVNNSIRFTSETIKKDCLFSNEDGKELSIHTINDYVEFDTMEESTERFVSLSDFIINGNYVGYRLEPTKEGLDKMIALYEYKDTYLVINENGEYNVISKHHPMMEYYKVGEIVYDNTDKKSIYLDIFKQKFNHGFTR